MSSFIKRAARKGIQTERAIRKYKTPSYIALPGLDPYLQALIVLTKISSDIRTYPGFNKYLQTRINAFISLTRS